jgi:D-amino peptidase
MRPFVLANPITLEIAFKHYQPAEILSYLRAVQRTDSHTIRFVGKDMAEVADFLAVVGAYSPDLAP